MLQPKVYIKHLDKVLEVKSIRFDTKVVEIYDESWNKYRFFVFDFDEVEFIENTGFKDNNGSTEMRFWRCFVNEDRGFRRSL